MDDSGLAANGLTPQGEPSLIDASRLAQALRTFAQERDWQQFHSPKNLVMALSAECGELAEIFQWMTEEQSRAAMADEATAEAIKGEVADVLLYLVQVASSLGVDLDEAARSKLKINASKYPAAKARGSSRKYTQLDQG